MKLINLIEDGPGDPRCAHEHGLCFYLETSRHRYLLDFGASDAVIRNAAALGVDLSGVDIGILSHGHYDHSGGILPFLEINRKTVIYMQKPAAEGHYHQIGDWMKNIGIDPAISGHPQVCAIEGNLVIDSEAEVYTNITGDRLKAEGGRSLLRRDGDQYVPDSFRHEQCAAIHAQEAEILFSGCAHTGIVNILEEYRRLYRRDPDLVISGFHLNRKDGYTEADYGLIRAIAEELKNYKSRFDTGHCTGREAFDTMKPILGDALAAIRCGGEIEI